MKNWYLKFKNWFYITLAGLLGLQLSCSGKNPMNEPKCIYGPPEMLNGGGRYSDDDDSVPESDEISDDDNDEFDFDEEKQKT